MSLFSPLCSLSLVSFDSSLTRTLCDDLDLLIHMLSSRIYRQRTRHPDSPHPPRRSNALLSSLRNIRLRSLLEAALSVGSSAAEAMQSLNAFSDPLSLFHDNHSEFTQEWWTWLIATGVFLALNISCKMVGLFMFCTIGSAVVIDLWNILDIRRGHSMVGISSPSFL